MRTTNHHPTTSTLAAFAAGTLDEGRGLVVATHLCRCVACRSAICDLEQIGGLLLDALPPSLLSATADDVLSRATAETIARDTFSPTSTDEALPPPLNRYPLGPWRWIGPGVYWRAVTLPAQTDTRVFMLKGEPGTRLPHHRHTGDEWTCVLQGAFVHNHGRYGPGDFDEADETVDHNPVVADGAPCICLVALQGRIVLQGLIGRLLQPLVRM